MKNTKKAAVVAKVPATETKKVATKKSVAVEKKTATKKEVAKEENPLEVVTVATTTYHNWRHWVKYIAKEGGVIGAKFVKEETGYNGEIKVTRSQVAKLKTVFAAYQKANPETKELWQLI